ncbi:MAG: hypothetical protein K9H26_11895 [Prolixibacteraceae bacterium]|jgi:hypothetical protein|nr:hypothetical protein [Prolixibacteraceae bacterium]
MKPFKAAVTFSKWLLRIALVVYLIAYYHDTIFYFDFLDVSFIFAIIYVFAAICLLLGGFRKDSNITVYASLILLIAVAFNFYLDIGSGFFGVIYHFLPLSIAFFFLANGNK